MSNKKDINKYENFKWLKRKEKAIESCQDFTTLDNIYCYSKSAIIKLVPLNFIEKISTGRKFCRPMPADICC